MTSLFRKNAILKRFPWVRTITQELQSRDCNAIFGCDCTRDDHRRRRDDDGVVRCYADYHLVDIDQMEEISVERIDRNFLERKPQYDGATGSLVSIDDDKRIYLVSASGHLLAEVAQEWYVRHNEAYVDDESREGETVGKAIAWLENPDSVEFALVVHTGYEIENHHSIGGYRVTVHKPPKGFTLQEWVDEQERRADAMLQASIAEIDAEGGK